MPIQAVTPGIAAVLNESTAPKNNPEKVKDAARQFEALLIGQILKSMREAEGGWLGTGEDQASASGMDYAQEIFAQALSANGGLGLARMVSEGLQPSGEH